MQQPEALIQIFCRAPQPGAVKTRLIPTLGSRGAAGLHQRLAEQCIRRIVAAGLAPVELWCAPTTQHAFFQYCEKRYGLSLRLQHGDDLGMRMFAAADSALARGRRVLIVGTDCPALSAADLKQALAALSAGSDVVLGPAEDGGYVLLGLRRVVSELFSGIPWGSAEVLRRTRERLQGLGWQWQEIRQLWDVDRPADYRRLQAEGLLDD